MSETAKKMWLIDASGTKVIPYTTEEGVLDSDGTQSIPRIKTNVKNVSDETLDVKMLGWSVPSHMGIKNTITAYGLFQQNVGRIKIKMHTWNTTAAGIFYASLTERAYGNGNFNVSSNNYTTHTNTHSTALNIASLVAQYGDGIYVNSGSNTIFVADSRYSTDAQFIAAAGGEYLYYEMATKPAAINIDGNEATLPQGIDDASGLNLISSVGTISNIHFVRIGKLVNLSFTLTQTADVASGDTLVAGVPAAAVNVPVSCYTSAAAATHSTAIVNTFGRVVGYFDSDSTKIITINATYITA